MTDKQENELRMYYTVSAVCDANTEIWESNEVFSASYKKFRSKIPEIRKYNDLCRIESIASETFKSIEKNERKKSKTNSDFLKKYIKEAREVLKENLDMEIAFFKNSDPDFYNLYKAAREVMQLEMDAMPTFSGKLMDYAN